MTMLRPEFADWTPPTTEEFLTACARRGAKLLDKEAPGWHEKVRPGDLVFWDTERGLIKMIYGDVERGVRALAPSTFRRQLPGWLYRRVIPAVVRAHEADESYRFAHNYGFHLGPKFKSNDFEAWGILQAAWVAEVEARVRPAADSVEMGAVDAQAQMR